MNSRLENEVDSLFAFFGVLDSSRTAVDFLVTGDAPLADKIVMGTFQTLHETRKTLKYDDKKSAYLLTRGVGHLVNGTLAYQRAMLEYYESIGMFSHQGVGFMLGAAGEYRQAARFLSRYEAFRGPQEQELSDKLFMHKILSYLFENWAAANIQLGDDACSVGYSLISEPDPSMPKNGGITFVRSGIQWYQTAINVIDTAASKGIADLLRKTSFKGREQLNYEIRANRNLIADITLDAGEAIPSDGMLPVVSQHVF